jgi:hypothetical protein
MSNPVINTISPAFGYKTGGQVLTITGQGFLPSPTVLVDGLACTLVTVNGTNTIICTTPADTNTGLVNVTVTNTDTGTYTLAQCFYIAVAGLFHQIADVSAELLKRNFTNASNILAGTLQTWINQTEARIIGRVSLRYSFPITQAASPQAYAMLGYICTLLSADRADRVGRNNAAADDKGMYSKSFARGTRRLTEGEALLEDIMTDRLLLLDAVRPVPIEQTLQGSIAHTQQWYSSMFNNVIPASGFNYSFNPANKNGRTMQMGQQQW